MSESNSQGRRSRGQSSILSGTTVKTIATTAAVAYGAYKAYEYWKDDEDNNHDALVKLIPEWLSSLWLEDEAEDMKDTNRTRGRQNSTRRKKALDPRTRHRLAQQGIRKCRQETVKAYTTCWPALQQVIEDCTDTIPLTQELRVLRQQTDKNTTTTSQERQEELWRLIQTETLTRFVVSQFASSLLILSLTLQLHWIGGQVSGYQQQDDLKMAQEMARMAQHAMMQSHEYVKTQGLLLLIAAVRRAIAASPMADWKPTTMLSQKEFEHALTKVDAHLEKGGNHNSAYSRNWIRIVFPDPTSICDSVDSESEVEEEESNEDPSSLSSMFQAFWDLAESPAWQDAQLQTIQTTKTFLREHGWGPIFQTTASEAEADKECKVPDDMTPVPVQVPLAKLMAPLKTSCELVDGQEPSETKTMAKSRKTTKTSRHFRTFLSKVQKLPTVLELGEVSFQQ